MKQQCSSEWFVIFIVILFTFSFGMTTYSTYSDLQLMKTGVATQGKVISQNLVCYPAPTYACDWFVTVSFFAKNGEEFTVKQISASKVDDLVKVIYDPEQPKHALMIFEDWWSNPNMVKVFFLGFLSICFGLLSLAFVLC